MKILVHLASGFEEIEAITTIDILRRANIDTEVVSICECTQVMGAHGIEVRADVLFARADYDNADIILLPGGMPGTKHLSAHKGLIEKIREHHKQGKWLAAICAAPSVFGKMGLLENVEATCYPSFEPELKGAIISAENVVINGQFITAKGPAFTIDFALAIVKLAKGEEVAKQVAQGIIKL